MSNQAYSDKPILINNTALPVVPSSIKMAYMDLDADSSTRSLSTGKLKRDRIRTNMVKINLSFNHMTNAQFHSLLVLVKNKFFTVSYWSDDTDAMTTGTFVAGNREYEYVYIKGGDLDCMNATVNLIEQ